MLVLILGLIAGGWQMTRVQRRSKSQYLNAARKLGYRPRKGFVYRQKRWYQTIVFRLCLRVSMDAAGGMEVEEELVT